MTGVDIVGALLRADPDLLAIVPEVWIKAARLPDGFALTEPLRAVLLLRLISSTERQPLKHRTRVRTVDRVAVTVRAGSYRDQRAVMELVKSCCRGRTGNIAGGLGVSVLTAGTGPDVIGPGNTFEATQDFRVSYDAPA